MPAVPWSRAVAAALGFIALALPLPSATALRQARVSADTVAATLQPDHIEHVLDTTFFIQWVGRQQNANQPRSPFSLKSLCLSVGKLDRMRGYSLSWQLCQNGQMGYVKFDAKARRAQQFMFSTEGWIKTPDGYCLRRMPCSDRRYMYDVGECDKEFSTVFRVKRAMANNLDRLKDMGVPASAVAREEGCELCGPYLLVQQCSLGSKAGCEKHYMSPGWTKQPSSYMGDAAVRGEAQEDRGTFEEKLMKNIYLDNGGLGRTDADGICGSYVTDGMASESFFYFVTAPK